MLQVINTGVKVWSRNNDGEQFGCAFRLAQEVSVLSLTKINDWCYIKIVYFGISDVMSVKMVLHYGMVLCNTVDLDVATFL